MLTSCCLWLQGSAKGTRYSLSVLLSPVFPISKCSWLILDSDVQSWFRKSEQSRDIGSWAHLEAKIKYKNPQTSQGIKRFQVNTEKVGKVSFQVQHCVWREFATLDPHIYGVTQSWMSFSPRPRAFFSQTSYIFTDKLYIQGLLRHHHSLRVNLPQKNSGQL